MIPTIIDADMREAVAGLDADSIDAVVTDPPYGLAFMGKGWDHAVPGVEYWTALLRVMKPGAYLAAFGGPRTFHRMAVAIEDAGFEMRDTLLWLYGTGWPKSPEQLKPAWEPITLARKPLAGTVAQNVLTYGTGGLDIDGCRVPATGRPHRISGGRENDRSVYGTGWEAGSQAAGVTDVGRWPANVLHDGSDEVEAAFLAFGKRTSGSGNVRKASGADRAGNQGAAFGAESRPAGSVMVSYGDTGSASRFFFCAKATKADRAGSRHPTVKPIALMRWLVRLITPRGGLVLDPFAGSGTTGAAASAEGMRAILIEREAEYIADIRRRFGEAAPLFAGTAE